MKKYHYIEMTYKEIESLDRGKTIIMSSISPIETHGPHLPMGTDIYIAEALRDRILQRADKLWPEHTALIMPTIPFGAGPIPVRGSIKISHRTVYRTVLETGLTLQSLGFRYWMLTDNHGDPTHQVALERASRKLHKKGLCLVLPFNRNFRLMVAADPELTRKTGLGPGSCGDLFDSHAGTNETSLMMASHPENIRMPWKQTGPAKKSTMGTLPSVLNNVSRLLKAAGATDAALDFYFMAGGLAWISDPDMDSYQGDPSKAAEKAGEAMFRFREETALKMLKDAMEERPFFNRPMGWSVRFLTRFMP